MIAYVFKFKDRVFLIRFVGEAAALILGQHQKAFLFMKNQQSNKYSPSRTYKLSSMPAFHIRIPRLYFLFPTTLITFLVWLHCCNITRLNWQPGSNLLDT